MRKVVILLSGLAVLILLSGCAASLGPQIGSFGVIYTGVSGPVTATGTDAAYTKVGTSNFVNVLGLIAVGNASIEKASRNGGITKIHHVDYKTMGILGLFASTTVYVYGD